MTQIAAEVMGLPLDDVTFNLGDSDLPQSPVEGGSWTVSSNGSAVKMVCEAIKKEVFKLTRKMDESLFADAEYEDVIFADGEIKSKTDASKSVSIFEAMRREKNRINRRGNKINARQTQTVEIHDERAFGGFRRSQS